jgi:hypothetical protein
MSVLWGTVSVDLASGLSRVSCECARQAALILKFEESVKRRGQWRELAIVLECAATCRVRFVSLLITHVCCGHHDLPKVLERSDVGVICPSQRQRQSVRNTDQGGVMELFWVRRDALTLR